MHTVMYVTCISFSRIFRVRFFPNFLDPTEADDMYNDFYHEIPWRQRHDVKNGESFLQPRLTAWYGDFPYSYSGVRHEANTEVLGYIDLFVFLILKGTEIFMVVFKN